MLIFFTRLEFSLNVFAVLDVTEAFKWTISDYPPSLGYLSGNYGEMICVYRQRPRLDSTYGFIMCRVQSIRLYIKVSNKVREV